MVEDFEQCFRAVSSRDARFDGWFVIGVTSTGIYCRPSCPAMVPKREHIRVYATAAGAQTAGYRACKRCRPDASPGSPEWNVRADLTGRAMRLIADGVVDRDGVAGLASRLGYSERHLHRQLVAELGAGPLALARAQRAQTARTLIETTDLPFGEVAFGAGFASIRQFNDTVRDVFAATPTELRRRGRMHTSPAPGVLQLRLPYREPFDAAGLLAFLGSRTIPGIEEVAGGAYRRSLRLPHGSAIVTLSAGTDRCVRCELKLDDVRDLQAAVQRCRHLLDLDADPVAIAELLSADELLAPLVRRMPGRRVPGCSSGDEIAIRAVLGQQVSVKGARTLAGRIVAACGEPLRVTDGELTHLFPTPAALAEIDPSVLAMPQSRKRTVIELAASLASGTVSLDRGASRDEAVAALAAIPGIGPWTIAYVAMRALGDPDAFLPSDLGVRHAIEQLGLAGDPASIERRSKPWRPWRAYATQHLWASLDAAA